MIKALRRIIGGTADAHIIETHEIMIKCARRCAYDLGHAISLMHMDKNDWRRPIYDQLQANQEHWIGLFRSGNTMKDYRIKLHNDIDNRDAEIARLRAIIEAHGIDGAYTDDDIPF